MTITPMADQAWAITTKSRALGAANAPEISGRLPDATMTFRKDVISIPIIIDVIRNALAGGLLVAIFCVSTYSQLRAGGAGCTHPTYKTSDPRGGFGFPNSAVYFIDNDLWNAANYPGTTGTLHVCGYSQWSAVLVASNSSRDGAVKAYPNVHRDYSDPPLSSFKVLNVSFAGTAWGRGIYDVAYDVWLNHYKIEVMIWTENHDQLPSGQIVASGVSISGHTWDLWQGGGGYFAFAAPLDPTTARPGNRVISSGNFDIVAFSNYLIKKGLVPSTAKLTQLDYGVEVVDTGGVPQTFKLTNFQITDH